MFKATLPDDEIFCKKESNEEKPKKKKTKRKCSEKQLENLRRARQKAKQNREMRKKEKETKKNSNTIIPSSNTNNTNDTNTNNNTNDTNNTDTKVQFFVGETPIQKVNNNNEPKKKPKQKRKMNYPNFMTNNPLNINYTELIKHQMTLKHKTYMYNQMRKQKRNTNIRGKQVNNYEKEMMKHSHKNKPIIPMKEIAVPNNCNKRQNNFFNGMFT
tara:strand:+ start:136 stop:777 length:642 start_codon:yes stop_codon:yes gene_type:complete